MHWRSLSGHSRPLYSHQMIYRTPFILQDFSNPHSYKLFHIPTKNTLQSLWMAWLVLWYKQPHFLDPIFGISYFCHCLTKYPKKKINIGGGSVGLTLFGDIVCHGREALVGRAAPADKQEQEAMSYIPSVVRKQRDECCCQCIVPFFSLLSPGPLSLRWQHLHAE